MLGPMWSGFIMGLFALATFLAAGREGSLKGSKKVYPNAHQNLKNHK